MKVLTRSEAESKRLKAIEFLRRIGKDDDADRFEDMSTDEYAEHKVAQLLENPHGKRRTTMAQRKTELQQAQDDIGDVKDILQEAYTPESSREDLAEAIGKALATLEDYESGDDDDTDDDNGDNYDDPN
jgi:hypothetical protein